MKNLAASVQARLAQRRAKTGEDFNVVLVRFCLERLLYRLSRSVHREQFVLKGAMLFALWEPTLHRVTRDLDLLGFGDPTQERSAAVFRELCRAKPHVVSRFQVLVVVDGSWFFNIPKYSQLSPILIKQYQIAVSDLGLGDWRPLWLYRQILPNFIARYGRIFFCHKQATHRKSLLRLTPPPNTFSGGVRVCRQEKLGTFFILSALNFLILTPYPALRRHSLILPKTVAGNGFCVGRNRRPRRSLTGSVSQIVAMTASQRHQAPTQNRSHETQTPAVQVYLFPAFPPFHCRALNINYPFDFIGDSRFSIVPANGAKAGPEKDGSSTKSSTEFLPPS